MSFSATASLISTEMDNTLRGLYRDNSDHAVTGTTNETDMASTTITGGTIGATGMLHIIGSGTSAGTAGTKSISVKFGGGQIAGALAIATATHSWTFDMWIINTSTSTQRNIWRMTSWNSGGSTLVTDIGNAVTGTIDTSVNQALKLTGTLTNGGDTLTQKTFNVFVCQIQ